MNLVSIPANPVPEGVVTGMLKTPDGVALRFARWAPPPGRKGTVCLFPGPRRVHREIFRDRARSARARVSRSRRSTGAGRAVRSGSCAIRARAMCAASPNTTSTSRPSSRGRAAGLSAAGVCARAFDGRDRPDARRASGPSLVRPHGAAGADDRPAGPAPFGGDARRGAARCGCSGSAAPTCPAATRR